MNHDQSVPPPEPSEPPELSEMLAIGSEAIIRALGGECRIGRVGSIQRVLLPMVASMAHAGPKSDDDVVADSAKLIDWLGYLTARVWMLGGVLEGTLYVNGFDEKDEPMFSAVRQREKPTGDDTA